MTPMVTIGLPVFNGENYLSSAITSILAQDYGDFELVISDNGSTDGTRRICEEATSDPRVRYIRQPKNVGAARNFNLLVDEARAPYFKWASHDDELAPDYLRRCIELLEGDQECAIASTGIEMIDASGDVLGSYHDTEDSKLSDTRPSVRLRELARLDYACFDVFGVIRTDLLRRTDRIDAFITSDRSLLVELGLLGTIRRAEGELFKPREHQERSTRALATWERGYWWNADSSGGLNLPHWQLFLAYFGIVRRNSLPRSEKLSCLLYLASWPVTNAKALTKDLVGAGLSVIRTGTNG